MMMILITQHITNGCWHIFCNSISSWAVYEQNRLWHESSGCRQAKYFLHRPDYSRARFALNLVRKDLRILVGLLTGHADLNRHLCIMGIRLDSGCPLCRGKTRQLFTLMLLRKDILGAFTLSLDMLSDIHWLLLLRFAKASKRFHRPWGLSGMCTGPVLWPQRWVSA